MTYEETYRLHDQLHVSMLRREFLLLWREFGTDWPVLVIRGRVWFAPIQDEA